jgi:hypothetical protein
VSAKYCPKHPWEKMTLLFQHYVCDTCEPPKGAAPKAAEVWVSVDYDTAQQFNAICAQLRRIVARYRRHGRAVD